MLLFSGGHQTEYALVAVYKKLSTLTLHSAAVCSRQEPLSNQDSKIPLLWAQVTFSAEERGQPVDMNDEK